MPTPTNRVAYAWNMVDHKYVYRQVDFDTWASKRDRSIWSLPLRSDAWSENRRGVLGMDF